MDLVEHALDLTHAVLRIGCLVLGGVLVGVGAYRLVRARRRRAAGQPLRRADSPPAAISALCTGTVVILIAVAGFVESPGWGLAVAGLAVVVAVAGLAYALVAALGERRR